MHYKYVASHQDASGEDEMKVYCKDCVSYNKWCICDKGHMVLEYFPDANDEFIEFVVWEKTGYPSFWEGSPEKCFRKQLQEFKDTLAPKQGE